MKQWPTARRINNRIWLSEEANDRRSPLRGKGRLFLRLGKQYGINPAVVVAICQRECQLGADGSRLPEVNNFGGVSARWNRGADEIEHQERWWATWPTPEAGLEGIFLVLAEQRYRDTDGTLGAVMTLYSPPFENDWTKLWPLFAAVGEALEVDLTPKTMVYQRPPRWHQRLRRP